MLSVFVAYGGTSKKFVNRNLICPMPPSWTAGLFMYVNTALDSGMVPIIIPADAPLPMTAEYMDQVHTSVPEADGGVYVPALLKELVKNPTYIDNIKNMRVISFTGAPLDKETGDILATFAAVLPLMGSTEVGSYGLRINDDPKDW
jgi:hypothetical protein